jgi:hypothetical protein
MNKLTLWIVSPICIFFVNKSFAGYEFSYEELSGNIGLGAGGSTVSVNNNFFGMGNGRDHDSSWQEFYLKPSIDAEYKYSSKFSLLGGTSLVSAATLGDGDSGGFTEGGADKTALEALYAGTKIGNWSLKFGNLDYKIGSGFIVMDGNADTGKDAAFFLGPRSAFQKTAVLDWAHDKVNVQMFSLQADKDLNKYRLNGSNVDYLTDSGLILGSTAMKVTDIDDLTINKLYADGMQVYNLRLLQAKVPSISNLTFDAEYAVETGSGKSVEYDANAWYAQASYATHFLYSPIFGYRYSHFSGDDNADSKQKAWESLSKGFTSWGTWLMGDITGNYLMNNSNENVHQFSVRTFISDTVSIGAIYYKFQLDKANYMGTPVSSKKFGDEHLLYVDWTPTKELVVSLAYSYLNPSNGAIESYAGSSKHMNAMELFFLYNY